jgi:hypothetical protein
MVNYIIIITITIITIIIKVSCCIFILMHLSFGLV